MFIYPIRSFSNYFFVYFITQYCFRKLCKVFITIVLLTVLYCWYLFCAAVLAAIWWNTWKFMGTSKQSVTSVTSGSTTRTTSSCTSPQCMRNSTSSSALTAGRCSFLRWALQVELIYTLSRDHSNGLIYTMKKDWVSNSLQWIQIGDLSLIWRLEGIS